MKNKYVSTSSLAQSIGINNAELFNLLESFHLIVRINKRWELTKAGQDVGGIYKSYSTSPFIVWPLTILEHPKFAHFQMQNEIPESRLHNGVTQADGAISPVASPVYPLNMPNDVDKYVSTTVLAQSIGIDRAELFNLLESLQFIVRTNKRWRLTQAGKEVGGIYKQHRGRGVFIVWSLAILEHPKFAHFQIQNEIPESKLHDNLNSSVTISSGEFNSSVTIPAYPTVDIDFTDVKNVIDQKLVDFVASSSIVTMDEVTEFFTQIVCDIGYNLGYQIEKEPLYHITDLIDEEEIEYRGDVVWKKNSIRIVMWEIDSTNKTNSAIKLMTSPAKYNVWLLWAKKVSRLRINCVLHRQDCQIIRPAPNVISDLWSKINQNKTLMLDLQK